MPTPDEVEILLEDTRRALRRVGYTPRTHDTYVRWLERFLDAFPGTPIEGLGRFHIKSFLSQLAVEESLAPKTRNQAASALAFVFKEVLGREEAAKVPRARESRNVPTVLSHRQVELVLRELSGKYRLMGALMYGTGLRLTECHELRIKDIDFDLYQITVRDGKGGHDRWVMLPERLVPALKRQIERVRGIHSSDRKRGGGWARLPGALARKDPTAGYDFGWQFLFPSSRMTTDPETRRKGRYRLNPTAMQRHIKKAARVCGVMKPVSCHTLRRSFATQMLRAGYDVRSVQKLMGHRDLRTTMIYVEAVTDAGIGMRSPLDRPGERD